MLHAFQPGAQRRVCLPCRFPTRCRPAGHPLAVIPLLNVTLLLWLFFILNESFILQPGLRLELPAAAFTTGTRYGPCVVTLTQEELIFFNNERMSLGELKSALAQTPSDHKEAPLLIEADGRVRHHLLVALYTLASEAGFHEVVLASRLPERGADAP